MSAIIKTSDGQLHSVSKIVAKIDGEVHEMRTGWTKVNGVVVKIYDNNYIPPPPPPPPPPPEAVEYMAINFIGQVLISSDGITFTDSGKRVTAGESFLLYNPADDYYYYCEKKTSRANMQRTKDGVEWEVISGAPTFSIGAIAVGDGHIVVMEENGVKMAYSSDGENWTTKSVAVDVASKWGHFSFLPTFNIWVLQPETGAKFYRFNSLGATGISVPLSQASGPVKEVDGHIYATGNVSTSGLINGVRYYTAYSYLYKSEDGLSFTQDLRSTAANNVNIVSNGSVKVCSITQSRTLINAKVSDAWNTYAMPVSMDEGASSSNGPTYARFHLGFVNGVFVAVSGIGISIGTPTLTRAAYSDDGVSWTSSTTLPRVGAATKLINAGQNLYVISANNSRVQYTKDGMSWEDTSLTGTQNSGSLVIASKVGED